MAKRLNSKGFTLAEVVVAAGLIGILSVALTQVINLGNKSSKSMSQQLDIVQLTNRIQQVLRDKDSCRLTFANETLVDNDPATDANAFGGAIVNADGDTVVAPGDRFGKIIVTGFEFANVEAVEGPVFNYNGTDARKRPAMLRVRIQRGLNASNQANVKSTLGNVNTVRDFQLTFFVDNADNDAVLGCNSDEAQYVRAACSSLDGEIVQDDLCRSIHIRDSVADPMAAEFDGDVTIRNGTNAGNTGTLNVEGGLNVAAPGAAVANALIDGDLTVDQAISAGTSITAGTTVDAGTSMSAGTSITAGTTITATESVTAGTTVTAGTNLQVGGNANVDGNTTIGGRLDVAGYGTIESNMSAYTSAQNKDIPNKEWVYRALTSTTFTQATKEAIVKSILDDAVANRGYDYLKNALFDDAGSSLNRNCASGEYIEDITYNSASNTWNVVCRPQQNTFNSLCISGKGCVTSWNVYHSSCYSSSYDGSVPRAYCNANYSLRRFYRAWDGNSDRYYFTCCNHRVK